MKGWCDANIEESDARFEKRMRSDLRRSAKLLFRNFYVPIEGGTLPPHAPWEVRVQLPDANVPVTSTRKAVSMPDPSSRVWLTNR